MTTQTVQIVSFDYGPSLSSVTLRNLTTDALVATADTCNEVTADSGLYAAVFGETAVIPAGNYRLRAVVSGAPLNRYVTLAGTDNEVVQSSSVPPDAALTTKVDAISIAMAGMSPVEPTGRIANGGRVLAYVGDDFTVRSGTALPIPVKDPAGGLYTLLTAIGVENLQFGASLAGKPAGLITGTIASLSQSGSGASQLCNITVEITNCGVGLKLSEDYEWQIQSTQTHGDETDTLIRLEGMLSLRRNVVG